MSPLGESKNLMSNPKTKQAYNNNFHNNFYKTSFSIILSDIHSDRAVSIPQYDYRGLYREDPELYENPGMDPI